MQNQVYCLKTEDIKLKIIVKDYNIEESKQGNKYNTVLSVAVNSYGFCGNSTWIVDYNDLVCFANKLKQMFDNLCGQIHIQERDLGSILNVQCDETGHFVFDGQIVSDTFQKLIFEFKLDQTYMKKFIYEMYIDFGGNKGSTILSK